MSTAEDRIELEAIDWRLRVPTLDDAGWRAFTVWLEADPAHARAYDLVVLAEGDADILLRSDAGGQPIERIDHGGGLRRSKRPVWIGAAAAAIVAIVGGGLSFHGRQAPQPDRVITTGPGEHRALRLADGSLIAINGDSRLTIAGTHARQVRLERGEAAFQIVHHFDRPFELLAGTTVLRDVGTFFDVARRGDGLEVAVGDGSVAYDPDGSNVILTAGQSARAGGTPTTIEIHEIDRKAVGSWRTGRLVYRDAPLSWIATDIGRTIGKSIAVDPDAAGQRFSGTIIVTHDDAAMRARLAGLLNVAVVTERGGWRLRTLPHVAR